MYIAAQPDADESARVVDLLVAERGGFLTAADHLIDR
jgi:hypothetical protein